MKTKSARTAWAPKVPGKRWSPSRQHERPTGLSASLRAIWSLAAACVTRMSGGRNPVWASRTRPSRVLLIDQPIDLRLVEDSRSPRSRFARFNLPAASASGWPGCPMLPCGRSQFPGTAPCGNRVRPSRTPASGRRGPRLSPQPPLERRAYPAASSGQDLVSVPSPLAISEEAKRLFPLI